MYLDNHREIIEGGVFNIPDRLKQIDPGYFVVRNHATQQFEVHHSGQIGSTLAVNIPYDELDCRTIEKVKSTRIEYAANVLAEMERNNEKLAEDRRKKANDRANEVIKDIHRYVRHHSNKETIDNNSELIKNGVI